jgi:C1A family cysteine protease
MNNFTYGWVPDIPDFRDNLYSVPLQQKKLPLSIDLRSQCSPVETQGELGSCTANALAGALEFLILKNKKSLVNMSRLFIYYNERELEDSIDYDSGASLRDGIKTLTSQGCCSETLWPYNTSAFSTAPYSTCYTEALKYTITEYTRLNTTYDMRSCLSSGFPFVFGFSVYSSFESEEVAKTGVVHTPSRMESLLGGHAVMAVGYDDKFSRFIARNSWGTNWGQNGYFTIPYSYLADRNLSDDFWAIKADKGL